MEPNQLTPPAANIIRELAAVQSVPVKDGLVFILPPGFKAEFKADQLDYPRQIEQKVVAHDVPGFIDYTIAYKGPQTALFAALTPSPALLAIFDYHATPSTTDNPLVDRNGDYYDIDGEPLTRDGIEKTFARNRLHRLTCELARSEEWKRWTNAHRKHMGQKEFAEFLEDNYRDVHTPPAGDLLALVSNFTSLRKMEFKSAVKLQGGQVQFKYVEDDTDAQQVTLPSIIRLGLPVFLGQDRYSIDARLKYSLKDAELKLWFELDRHDLVQELAYTDVLEAIAEKTGIKPYRGMPA